MSWLYVLLAIEIVYLCIAWLITDGNIVSTSVVVMITMIVSSLFNLYANSLWDESTFYIETMFSVILALSMVLLAEIICIQIFKKRRTYSYTDSNIDVIEISKGKVFFITFLCILFSCLYYFNIKQIGGRIGTSVASVISLIKSNYQDSEMQLNIVVRQGYKIINAYAYISGMIFVNNIIACRDIKKNIVHIIPAICLVIVCILSGGRVDIMRLFSALFFYSVVLMQEKYGWNIVSQKRTNKKFVKIAIPGLSAIAVLFTQLRTITKGDITTNQLTSVLDYVAYYIGGPLQVINIKIHNGIMNYRMKYWGELSFRGIWNFASKLGLTEEYIQMNLSRYEYLIIHMGIGGNTDTFLGPPLFDFGYIGMALFVFAEFLIWNFCYYKNIYRTRTSYHRNKHLLLYGFSFFVISMSYYDNCTYSIFSQNGVFSIIVLLIGYWFYFKTKITIRG